MRRFVSTKCIAAVVVAMALLIPTMTVGVAAAMQVNGTPEVAGPPLGYYYTSLRICQKDRKLGKTAVCRRAQIIVSEANNACSDLTVAGIIIAGLETITDINKWAVLAYAYGVGVSCIE